MKVWRPVVVSFVSSKGHYYYWWIAMAMMIQQRMACLAVASLVSPVMVYLPVIQVCSNLFLREIYHVDDSPWHVQ